MWVDSLADHLRFSEANLEKQVSMFETSSNSGAWCFCFMHVMHPCLVLSMTEVSLLFGGFPSVLVSVLIIDYRGFCSGLGR